MGLRRDDLSILVIGSGFAGIGLAIALKKAGFGNFTLLERADAIGGVWRDNTYPGAACDVPSRFYSYSFEPHWPWSRRFAPQKEILEYLRSVADKYRITRHVQLSTRIVSATFDEEAGMWRVVAADGRKFEARVLVSAIGLFNRIALPQIEGRETFAGPAFHSAHWRHDVDLAGKRVAVIGTGASAVQFVPEIAKKAGKVEVFQRTAQYVFAKDEAVKPASARGLTARLRALVDRLRVFIEFEKVVPRRFSPEKTARGTEAFTAYLASVVKDPELLRKLTPEQELGCKRVLQSNDWYPALQRENVEVVTDDIARIEPGGIRTRDGVLHEADVIIYGTGFTPTDFLGEIDVRGRGGRPLKDAWAQGASAYLGMSVPGFPNFFIMYGPNTNTSGSIIFMLEAQARYITRAIAALARRRAKTMELRPEALRDFEAFLSRRMARSVILAPNCKTYFKTAEGRVPTQWVGYMSEYAWRTRRPDLRNYLFDRPADAATRPVESGMLVE